LGRALRLLEAHALRDYPNMKALGEDWIQNRPADAFMARYFDGYAWSGTILHSISEKQWGNLASIVENMDLSSTINPEYSFLKEIARGLAKEQRRSVSVGS
jgi:hypothetical protein